jgi:Bacterial protein of unknown function (DUF922)
MVFKLITALSFCTLFSFNVQKEDSLQWSASRRLDWNDFKSSPDDNSGNAALTSSTIGFKYNYDSEKGFSYTINCLFEKNSSWGRVKTDYILSHEQGHFDIAEIYARKLYKTVQGFRFNPRTARKEVPAMYHQIMKDLAAKQAEYDTDTDFSRDKEEQADWLLKIRAELDNLQPYAKYWSANR